jgi:poly(3-hydroxybutyrate) depolymerase
VTCRDARRIAGLAMIRGPYLPPGCAPSRAVPVLIEADTTDAVIPFDGGWGSTSPSDPTYTPTGAEAARDGWADLDGCDPSATATTDDGGVAVTRRERCDGGASVTSRFSTGYGHAWPTDVIPGIAGLVEGAR